MVGDLLLLGLAGPFAGAAGSPAWRHLATLFRVPIPAPNPDSVFQNFEIFPSNARQLMALCVTAVVWLALLAGFMYIGARKGKNSRKPHSAAKGSKTMMLKYADSLGILMGIIVFFVLYLHKTDWLMGYVQGQIVVVIVFVPVYWIVDKVIPDDSDGDVHIVDGGTNDYSSESDGKASADYRIVYGDGNNMDGNNMVDNGATNNYGGSTDGNNYVGGNGGNGGEAGVNRPGSYDDSHNNGYYANLDADGPDQKSFDAKG